MWVRIIGRFEWQGAEMARWESWLRGRGGNHSSQQGMVWDLDCLEARIEQGVGRRITRDPESIKRASQKSGDQNIRQV